MGHQTVLISDTVAKPQTAETQQQRLEGGSRCILYIFVKEKEANGATKISRNERFKNICIERISLSPKIDQMHG